MPTVILISGRGSNMRVLAERASDGALPISIRAVVSDQPDAGGLVTAAGLGIDTATLSPRGFPDRASYDRALAELLQGYQPQLVVLAGFMRILSAEFVQQFAGRMLNIHPSLLPKYRGLHTHRRAIDAGEREHGASVHFVTEELDGGPVVIQGCVPVLPADTEATLSARVQRLEHRIYPQAADWFARGRLQYADHAAWLDGKRLTTPVIFSDDGPQ